VSDKRVSEMTDDEIREMATGISRDYFDLMNHLRDARPRSPGQSRPWT
jgi:hypothetical protein